MADAVKSADRVLDVLVLLAAHPRGLRFNEICDRLQWPRSSAHALLGTLAARGFLDLHENTRTYTIGVRTWEVGQAFLGGRDLAADALPHMEVLSRDLNETVQLAILDGRDNVYIAKVDSEQPLALSSRVGIRLPAHVTGVGKVLLADLGDDEVRELFTEADFPRFTSTTITTLDQLLTALAQVRTAGHAIDDGEYTPGVQCLAVAVRGRSGQAVAGLSVSVPDIRLDEDLRSRMLSGLQRAAAAIGARWGHSG